MRKTKPFEISQESVKLAWIKVKANKGSAGVDKMTIKDFETNCEDYLYKLWNRLSSGTYFPPPVKSVEIPKGNAGTRKLGIPTVTDRIAQMVVKDFLEPLVESKFHEDSYGYRPKKSAKEALGVCRKRNWEYDWLIDMDIKGFFDNLNHELVLKAVKFHCEEKWVHLYVKRWLEAPIEGKDGSQLKREKGTPQGGVISPLLANLFMHYAFDKWMERTYPEAKFERYADDVVIHCRNYEQTVMILNAVKSRLEECKLELHPDKTKIVYCKQNNRNQDYENISFDFLGYTFRPRVAKDYKGKRFIGFLPAMSNKAGKKIRQEIRKWRLHRQNNRELVELAKDYNSKIRGWINYYGQFYKSAMVFTLNQIDEYLIYWARRKYKRLKRSVAKARTFISKIKQKDPNLFAHWKYA